MKTAYKPEFEVKEGRTTIVVPHQGKRITFVAPKIGPGTYNRVGEQIDEAGLLRPTFGETVSLVYSAVQNKDNKYAKQVLDPLENYWLWAFNDIIYMPKEGAFISDRKRKDIHVPFGFKTGENSLDELVKNPFVLALAEGEEGVEKLAEIAKSLGQRHYVLSFDDVNSEVKSGACLSSSGDGRLYVDGNGMYGNCNGFAFGVSE